MQVRIMCSMGCTVRRAHEGRVLYVRKGPQPCTDYLVSRFRDEDFRGDFPVPFNKTLDEGDTLVYET